MLSERCKQNVNKDTFIELEASLQQYLGLYCGRMSGGKVLFLRSVFIMQYVG